MHNLQEWYESLYESLFNIMEQLFPKNEEEKGAEK